jgi:predicted ArsR family transcriptional regulator
MSTVATPVEVNVANELTKKQQIINLLKAKPHLTATQIARTVGCHVSSVYEQKKGGFVKAKLAKKTKAVKVGRPNMFDSLEKACETLLKFVNNRKDMCIAFDHSKKKVEIVWGEEIYNAGTEEVIDVLMAIKKLDTHRQTFN